LKSKKEGEDLEIERKRLQDEYAKWLEDLTGKAALHNPDMVAGGDYNIATYTENGKTRYEFGHAGANSSMGSQWANTEITRIQSIEEQLLGRTLPKPTPEPEPDYKTYFKAEDGKKLLNVRLAVEACQCKSKKSK